MKKLYFLLCFLPLLVGAQSYNQNFVKTTTYKKLTTTSITNPTPDFATVQISYFDGLGRPVQQIGVKQSNTGKDIITHMEYDAFGRQSREYMPYIGDVTSLTFDGNALINVGSFYSSPSVAKNGNPTFEATLNPFSEKQFEASPLNRVLKQAAPGNAWAMGMNHEIKMDYQANVASEVRLFNVVNTWNAANAVYEITLTDNGHYTFNDLYKTITKDENWTSASGLNNTTEEFKDKEGRVVLKRTYNNSTPNDTYYVYDIYGNLTYVIPPKVSGSVAAALDGLCYQYKYDYRKRLVEKKLPGKQWEYIVYDKLDKPVATGPAYSPYGDGTSGMMVTQYDVFSRPVSTGWKAMAINGSVRGSLQAQINSNSNPFVLSESETLTKNYYDNYTFTGAPSPIPATIEGQNTATNVRGLPTGSWVRVLTIPAETKTEVSYTIYDYKYRPIRTYTQNHLGGYTQTDANLDFAGVPQYTITTHKRVTGDTELKTTERFTYSAQGRLLTHTHQIGAGAIQLLVKNEYDELGQLIVKKVGGSDITGNTALQKVDYSYNIRGWLKEINNSANLAQAGQPTDLFAFKINYNTPESATALFNGNIAETFWKTSSDITLRKYSYSYDALNRLLDATYSKPGVSINNSYGENLGYDPNGNIINLTRYGYMDDNLTKLRIDNLTYIYSNNSNQLSRVTDVETSPDGFADGTNTDDDYSYDANGNMTVDKNKNITSIKYNHLNLPVKISFYQEGGSESIEYIYNAIGTKVKKKINTQIRGQANETDYQSGYQYVNNILQFFPTAEGYVNNTRVSGSNNYSYVFNYTDHLGNVRVSYKAVNNVLTILEENSYYPFGMKHEGYNYTTPTSNKYKYNGKELQDELGLNMYDYGNRNYDPALGRFMNMDKFAEKYYHLNPYQYGGNNPVIFNDIKGDSILIYSKQDKTHVKYDNGNLYSRNAKGKWEAYNGKNLKVDKNGNKTIGGFLGKVAAALDKIRTGGDAGNELVGTIQNDSNYIRIAEGSNASSGIARGVDWNDSNQDAGGNKRPSYIGLAHELGHALDGLDGLMDNTTIGVIGGKNIPRNELTAMHWENKVRGENGVSLRQNYGMGDNGQAVGQNINRFGQSLNFNQQLVIPTASLQAQFSSSGVNIVPVQTGNSTILIPYKY